MTTIKLERRAGGTWREVAAPFNAAKEVLSSKMASPYRFEAMRITVLSGKLTFRAPVLSGPNSPVVKNVQKGRVLNEGQTFLMDFYIGPVTEMKPGRHERSTVAVDTKELGVITTQSADVIYQRP